MDICRDAAADDRPEQPEQEPAASGRERRCRPGLKSTLLYDDEPSEACLGIDNYEQYYNDDILWALRRLKPIYREPLLLQQAGYKIGEITDILHRKGMLQSKNIETVKSRFVPGQRDQLRNLLTRDGEKRMD